MLLEIWRKKKKPFGKEHFFKTSRIFSARTSKNMNSKTPRLGYPTMSPKESRMVGSEFGRKNNMKYFVREKPREKFLREWYCRRVYENKFSFCILIINQREGSLHPHYPLSSPLQLHKFCFFCFVFLFLKIQIVFTFIYLI